MCVCVCKCVCYVCYTDRQLTSSEEDSVLVLLY